jgi:hypothetical protein
MRQNLNRADADTEFMARAARFGKKRRRALHPGSETFIPRKADDRALDIVDH